jgi:hypothetical protein
MAIALVQHTQKNAGVVTSTTLAFVSNNVAGNMGYATVQCAAAATTCTITDSNGNTWTEATHQDAAASSQWVFYSNNILKGYNLLTITQGSSVALRVSIAEYSGLDTTSPLDVTGSATATTSSALSVGPIITTQDGDLLTVAWNNSGTNVATAGSGYVIQEAVIDRTGFEDKIAGVAGSETGTLSFASNTTWVGVMAAFKELRRPVAWLRA